MPAGKPSVPRICELCSTPFMTWPYKLREGKGRYCSHACHSRGRLLDPTAPPPICPDCGQPKEVEVRNQGPRAGRIGYVCKPCRLERYKQWYADHREASKNAAIRWMKEHPERTAEARRQRYADDPSKFLESSMRWQANNTERVRMVKRVNATVGRAIARGLLTRPSTCEECGATDKKITAAHSDYSQPLLVRWLCYPCHNRWDHYEPKTR